jgi:hypothetical protein
MIQRTRDDYLCLEGGTGRKTATVGRISLSSSDGNTASKRYRDTTNFEPMYEGKGQKFRPPVRREERFLESLLPVSSKNVR